MHLAYLDDSDTKAKANKWQVMAAVLIEDDSFRFTELAISSIPEDLMGPENVAKFEEFHACELYGGYGPFQGIDQTRRFEAIGKLLALLGMAGISVVYGAVNLDTLRTDIYGSAEPVDVCFRKCLSQIVSWSNVLDERALRSKLGDAVENYTIENITPLLVDRFFRSLVILIVDECDGKTKSILHKSFRSLRPPRKSVAPATPFECFHDDMYFGDSRYSIGIQLADLCSYFIARHLEGDVETEEFYEMIAPRLHSHQPEDGSEPNWA